MKRIRRWGLAVTAALATAVALVTIVVVVPAASARGNVGAPVKAPSTGHTISVSGHGETSVAPDEATVSLGVQSKGNDAQSTLSDNSSKMAAVIAAVQAQGVPSSHIQTSELSMWYDSEHNSYVVSHTITARLDNVDKTGAVLDAAVAAGANNTWGVSFGLKDPSAARSSALKSAIADARKRADSMASGLGVSVTGVGSASEASYQMPLPVAYSGVAAAPAPVRTPVQPGQLNVTAEVNVVYTFG